DSQSGSAATPQQWTPASPEQFIRDVWPHAKRAAGSLGVQPEALVAQAALETGWGKHMIKAHDGASSFNMFGIKADSRWQGDRTASETLEFRDGLVRKERAQFRVYGSLKDSFNDYAEFLQRNPRYQDALTNTADTPAFTRSLKEAGYATDPAYSEKINNIMNSERVRATVAEIKASAPEPLNQV
ncbi:MAG: flagellar assembly peptidoglycan hydrolase FlgJ, partial [Thiogranum sp.]|nr:flagellar assembly peptidoglycan hydrolase FlgJ [Thiogranum sp.]